MPNYFFKYLGRAPLFDYGSMVGYGWIRLDTNVSSVLDTVGYGWIRKFWIRLDTVGYGWIRLDTIRIQNFGHVRFFGYGWVLDTVPDISIVSKTQLFWIRLDTALDICCQLG